MINYEDFGYKDIPYDHFLCLTCKEWKPSEAFWENNLRRRGVAYRCIVCEKKRNREKYLKRKAEGYYK